ncbi:hypothetical protein KKG46_06310, partial [Patescibacteria group bacterium]|nr:hypothetical protein [Patescibacteria group bacterium]
PPAILVNFHVWSDKLKTQLNLLPEQLTEEEWEARQKAREAQNTGVRAHMVDTGTPILNGQSGVTGLHLANFIRDLQQEGYKLVDAFIVPKYQRRANADGMVNTIQAGWVARFVFSIAGEIKFEDPSDSMDLLLDLIEELENMKKNVAPLIIVWRNKNPAGELTTDTVNIVKLSQNDERFGSNDAPRDLRFGCGEYRILSYNQMNGYLPLQD